MDQNPGLAKNVIKTNDARQKANELWKKITTDCNANGPPTRDVEGWKKVWCDCKFFLKKKLRSNKKLREGTGGGSYRQYSFSILEEKVIELIDLRAAVGGVMGAKSFGVNQSVNSPEESQELSGMDTVRDTGTTGNDLPTTSFESNDGNNNNTPPPPLPPSSRSKKKSHKKDDGEKLRILIEQSNIQGKFFKDITNKLDNIGNNVKELVRLKRKECKQREEIIDIEKRKLKIEEMKVQQMKEERISREKGNIMNIEIKKQKLCLEQEKLKLKQREECYN